MLLECNRSFTYKLYECNRSFTYKLYKLYGKRLIPNTNSSIKVNRNFSSTTAKDKDKIQSEPYQAKATSKDTIKDKPNPRNNSQNLLQQLKPFLRFAKPEFRIIRYSMILLLFSSAVTMSVPFSMGAIIDIVMEKESEKSLLEPSSEKETIPTSSYIRELLKKSGSLSTMFGLLGTVFIFGAVANAGRQILMTLASERVITRLRTRLFHKIIKQDISFHDSNRSGELISRLGTDTVMVGRTLTSNIADGMRSLVMTTAGIGAMLYVNVDLTLTMMLIVPGVSAIAVLYGRFVRKLARQTTDASAELTKFAEEKISNIRTVRSFAQEQDELKRYETRANKVLDLGVKEGIASAFFFSSMGFAGNMVILAILYYGGSLVHMGQISVGELTSFFLYTGYVGSSLIGLSNWYSDLNKGVGSGERIFQLLGSSTAIEDSNENKKQEIKGNIVFEGVDFYYPTRSEALIFKGLSFNLHSGENVAIVGHSGSGKSTIAQLLLRFYDPTKGKITLDGTNINELDPFWMRQKVMGLVSQEPTLFAATIIENIRYGSPNATDNQVIEASKRANAHEFVETFPQGYNTLVGERGQSISGGQKQRIAIARALLKNPKILVLDEASSALDTASENLVQQALDRLISDRTVITIAHRISTIQKADRIFMLGQGKVIESGTYEELIQLKGHFSKLIGSIMDEQGSNSRVILSD